MKAVKKMNNKFSGFFYIIQPNAREQWYRLHITETHYCLGGGVSVEQLLNSMDNYIKTFKSPARLLGAVHETEDGGRVYENTRAHYEEEYNTCTRFDEEVEEHINNAFEEVKNSTPMRRGLRKKAHSTAKPLETPVITAVETTKAELSDVVKKGKRKLMKKRVIVIAE